MPNTKSKGTFAGSAEGSGTASQASAADPSTSSRQNQNQGTESETRYASGYNGGPPNGGLIAGIYTNPNTGRQYILPEPPRLDGSNGPPQTSPFFPIYEYNGPAAPFGPATYIKSEDNFRPIFFGSGPTSGSGSGSGFGPGSGSGSGFQQGSGSPSNPTAETRIPLIRNGRVFWPAIYQHSGDNNDIDQPD